MMNKKWWLCLLLCAWLLPVTSWAVACKKDSLQGATSGTISLNAPIVVSTAQLTAGTLLWRSPSYTVTFKCYDTQNHPGGENGYFYWDPKNQLSTIHESLEVGVTYQSIDYNPRQQNRTEIGVATSPPATKQNCIDDRIFNRNTCARPQTITVTFSVYIKATGKAPPASGKIDNNGTYSLFQVDGILGLNNTPNSNYNLYFTGLGNIRFISCNPIVSVIGNHGNAVDFGKITAGPNAKVGVIEKTVPFTVQVALDANESGQACSGQSLVGSFSTNSPLRNQNTILPKGEDGGFGITISRPSSQEPIQMRTAIDLGAANGKIVDNQFDANFKWLSTDVETGPFSATAVVDVTLK